MNCLLSKVEGSFVGHLVIAKLKWSSEVQKVMWKRPEILQHLELMIYLKQLTDKKASLMKVNEVFEAKVRKSAEMMIEFVEDKQKVILIVD